MNEEVNSSWSGDVSSSFMPASAAQNHVDKIMEVCETCCTERSHLELLFDLSLRISMHARLLKSIKKYTAHYLCTALENFPVSS